MKPQNEVPCSDKKCKMEIEKLNNKIVELVNIIHNKNKDSLVSCMLDETKTSILYKSLQDERTVDIINSLSYLNYITNIDINKSIREKSTQLKFYIYKNGKYFDVFYENEDVCYLESIHGKYVDEYFENY